MGSKTKKIKHAGRFSGGIGVHARKRFNAVEAGQRKRQVSPYYAKGKAQRIAMGIWKDVKTGKVFAGPAYTLNK
jgi:ribosomal protein L37AE/L43A